MKLSLIAAVVIFNVNLILAQDLVPYRIGNKWGYADENKEIVIRALYDSAGLFGMNDEKIRVAKVKTNNSYLYINESGEQVDTTVTDNPKFHIQCAIVVESLKRIQRNLNRKLYFYKKDNKYGFNIKGDTILPPIFLDHGIYDHDVLNLKDAEGWKLYDSLGNALTNSYDTIELNSSHPLIIVRKNSKWGLIDRKGKEVKKNKYDRILQPSKHVSILSRKNKHELVDQEGKKILPYKFNNIYPYYRYVMNCILIEKKDGKLCFVDDYGLEFCEP